MISPLQVQTNLQDTAKMQTMVFCSCKWHQITSDTLEKNSPPGRLWGGLSSPKIPSRSVILIALIAAVSLSIYIYIYDDNIT